MLLCVGMSMRKDTTVTCISPPIANAEVKSKEQEESRELCVLKECNAKLKENVNMFRKKYKELKERLQEVGASTLINCMIHQIECMHVACLACV